MVAMSGGVDSSVAAALLVREGHEVVGVTMRLWGGESDTGCCSVADVDDARLRAVVTGYATALEQGDADRLVALLTEDVTWSMPPLPGWYAGIDDVTAFVRAVPLGDCGRWRTVATTANGQPAVALYLDGPALRQGPDDRAFRAWSLTVLAVRLSC